MDILFGIEKSQDLEINIPCTEITKSNITNLRHSALYISLYNHKKVVEIARI